MNFKDFIVKAEEGVKIMHHILNEGRNIYVHCSAGIYRSPQMIALYLIAIKQYSLDKAVNLLKEKHPYAEPNSYAIE